MKKVMKYIKKIFIVVAVIWTTITLGFIGLMAFSGPSSCSIDSPENENVSQVNEIDQTRVVSDINQTEVPDITQFYT